MWWSEQAWLGGLRSVGVGVWSGLDNLQLSDCRGDCLLQGEVKC